LEINFRRIKDNPLVHTFTLAEIANVDGEPGNYKVSVKLSPRFINTNCTACNECVAVCPAERNNEFNFGMDMSKAVYLPFEMAFPTRYVIDPVACQGVDCGKCVDVCKYDAIELEMKEKTIDLQVGSIIWATGWTPYDATRMDNLGFGQYPNIVTNMMLERLAPKTVLPPELSSGLPTKRRLKVSPLYNVPAPEMKIIFPIVPIYAAWLL
jgi:quinone-modifying oxidoreductase, subunit QmoA